MSAPLIIYHGPHCVDGFTAFYVAHQYFAAQGVAVSGVVGVYGEEPPDVTGREVYVLDFSYPREVLEGMFESAASLLVLDHHKTAQAALEGLPYAQFDMNRSGARMTWDHFYPGQDVPLLVAHVEDNDLWRHQLDNTEAVNLYIQQVPKTVEDWSDLEATSLDEIVSRGESMLQLRESYVEMLIPCAIEQENNGVRYWGVNAPRWSASQLLNRLCLTPFADGTYPAFAESWQDRRGGRGHELRSAVNPSYPQAYDVSTYARQYGGGGHHCAAGYKS